MNNESARHLRETNPLVASALACGKRASARSFCFVVISGQYFENDWRVALFRALKREGANFHHIRLGRVSVRTDPRTGVTARYHFTKIISLIRDIRALIPATSIPVYFVSTGASLPSLIGVLRAFLGRGIWLYDVYDDFSQYPEGRWKTLKAHVVNALFYRMMSATLISPPNLKKKFPRSFELGVASDILPIERQSVDRRKLLITSNLDHRLDYEFIRQLASKCPDGQIHIYGRVNDRARDWPQVEQLLKSAKNVKYHGTFPQSDFQKILSEHAIALVPFKTNHRLTRSTDPARYYDYLNAGLEVISTDVPRARDRANFVHIARDADGAATAWNSLRASGNEDKAGNWNYRQNLWETRARELVIILNEILQRRRKRLPERTRLSSL